MSNEYEATCTDIFEVRTTGTIFYDGDIVLNEISHRWTVQDGQQYTRRVYRVLSEGEQTTKWRRRCKDARVNVCRRKDYTKIKEAINKAINQAHERGEKQPI